MTLQDDLSRSRNAEERQETETFELKKKSPGYYWYIHYPKRERACGRLRFSALPPVVRMVRAHISHPL